MRFARRVLGFLRHHWLLLLLLTALAYALVTRVNYGEVAAAFTGVSWFYVFLAIIANLASIMLKVASWRFIFDYTFRELRTRWIDLTSALMIGFLVNALMPARLGEIARAYVISRREALEGYNISRSTVFGTIVLERVFDGIAMALIVFFGVFNMDLPTWADRGAVVLLAIAVLIGGALVFLELKREKLQQGAAAAQARYREEHPWWRKQLTRLHGIVARFSEGQQVLRSPGRVIAIFCTTTASWTSQLTAVYLSLHAFHLGFTGIMGALLLLILINVAGALPATPANVGIFQLATVIPLTLTYGSAPPGQACTPDAGCISTSTALAFSIGLQAIEGSIGLGIGSLFLLKEGLTFKQVRTESLREIDA